MSALDDDEAMVEANDLDAFRARIERRNAFDGADIKLRRKTTINFIV